MQTWSGVPTDPVPPILELRGIGLLLDVLLQRPRARVLVHDGPASSLRREVRPVDPVVERLSEVDHPEEEDQEQWQDQGKLDKGCATLVAAKLPETSRGYDHHS